MHYYILGRELQKRIGNFQISLDKNKQLKDPNARIYKFLEMVVCRSPYIGKNNLVKFDLSIQMIEV